MNTALLKQKIKEDLLSSKEFIDYKWIATKNGIFRIREYGYDIISFGMHQTIISDKNELAISVFPMIAKQFKDLHEWYNPFSYKSKSDLKYQFSVVYDLEEFEYEYEYESLFSKESDNFEDAYIKLKDVTILGQSKIEERFQTLKDIYLKFKFFNVFKNPITVFDFTHIDNFEEIDCEQFDWIFEFLFLIRLFCKEKFEFFKNHLFLHFKKVVDFGHPYALERYLKYDEIIEAMIKYQNDNNLIPEINI